MRVTAFLLATILVPSVARNTELAEEYRKYDDCLKRRDHFIKGAKQRHIEVSVVIKQSDVILQCFPCVSPDDALEIESTYKPSAGSVGRLFKKVVDFFKKHLSRSPLIFEKNKWTYDWEFAAPGREWKSITDVHRKKSFGERVARKVKRFLSRDTSKWVLGDRYELRLRDVNSSDTGFYRCINKEGTKRRIAQAHFLDVRPMEHLELINSSALNSKSTGDLIPLHVKQRMKSTDDQTNMLKIGPKAGPWSECSECGNKKGEQFRKISCYIESANPFLSTLPASSSWLKLFGSVPCESTVVPLAIRKSITQRNTTFIENRPCWIPCKSEKTHDRSINATNEKGERRIMDYIPKGEFLFGEVLPKLLPPVIRRSYMATESDPMVFTCDVSPDAPWGINWHSKSGLKLTQERLQQMFEDRIVLDDHGRLLFYSVEKSDATQYYCYSSERVLLGVHNLIVNDNDHSKELLKNVRMILKFAAFTFIFVLVVGTLLK